MNARTSGKATRKFHGSGIHEKVALIIITLIIHMIHLNKYWITWPRNAIILPSVMKKLAIVSQTLLPGKYPKVVRLKLGLGNSGNSLLP